MILIALGANLPWRALTPEQTLEAALSRLERDGVTILRRSSWYRSAPVPPSGQPDFINGAAALTTTRSAADFLTLLHTVEAEFARERSMINAARTIDLDLIDFDGVLSTGWPILPHPRLQERLFVLLPLREIAPDWRHPASGQSLSDMIATAPPGQVIERAVV